MKGFFLGMVCIGVLAFGVSAQTWPFSAKGQPIMPGFPTEKNGDAWAVDLFSAENLSGFFARAYPINMRFPADSAQMRYAIAGFDTLVSADTLRQFRAKQPLAYTLDSVEITLRHVKTSATTDTLIVDVVTLDEQGFPTLQVLHADTLLLSQSLAGGAPTPFYFLKQKDIPAQTSVGIRVRFWGNPQADTLHLIAGANADGACSPGLPKPVKSRFFPQAFAYYAGFELLVPNSGGGDFYSDCNANNLYDTLTDGANPVQTWNMRLFVQGPTLQLESHDASHSSLFPNPGHGDFTWHLPEKTSVRFSDAQGRIHGVIQPDHAGHYSLPSALPPGVYFLHAGKQVRTYILLP